MGPPITAGLDIDEIEDRLIAHNMFMWSVTYDWATIVGKEIYVPWLLFFRKRSRVPVGTFYFWKKKAIVSLYYFNEVKQMFPDFEIEAKE